uniref:Uncharacterized protein n=1 Tax=Rhinopithecus bieti TaxID=61621 RepID=A0A2K6KB95_RHIBE
MTPLSPRWFSGMEKFPCAPQEPCSRADETPARPAEHYSKMKESQRKRQMCWPVNSLISNVNQIQAMCSCIPHDGRDKFLPQDPGGP